MADWIPISANEMKFFIKRSLEGMGFNPGEQIEAGRRMASAWQYGLANSQLLTNCLQHLQPQIKQPKLVSRIDQVWTFDALGQSALVQAELGVGMALAHEAKQVVIDNVTEGVLLAPALMGWLSIPLTKSSSNKPMVLYFQQQTIFHISHTDMHNYALAIDATGQLQGLYKTPHQGLKPQQIKLHIGAHEVVGECVVSAMQLQNNKTTALNKGLWIELSLLDRLKTLIIASFVPESENSQAGAGLG